MLCDLEPLYLSLHLGVKGLRDERSFEDYRLVKRAGLILKKLFQKQLSNMHHVAIFRHRT